MPDGLELDEAETAGTRRVSVNYPESRASEDVARQCPYCTQVFNGKEGVAIHFGQLVGRRNHPKDRDEFIDPVDCPIVHLDENENIIHVVEGDATMPSTKRRTL
ncbi:hypothetical protein [Halomonas sp.]|uniref:hypothetical protein n=1 Tax=Halomonas sp. TaxID=1486246 RepID=UPI0035614BCD